MSNIVPNVDAQISVSNVTLLWNNEVQKNCMAVFQYNGPETPEVSQVVVDTRKRFQQINTLIGEILAALPAN